MIIQHTVATIILCAFICLNHVVIHEIGHYLSIKKWSRKLNLDMADTYIHIGDENSKQLCRFGIFVIMSRGYTKTGVTVSSFYKRLAESKNEKKIKAIRENTAAGARAILNVGLILLIALSVTNFRTSVSIIYIITTVLAGGLICFIAYNSIGVGKKHSDYFFWNNPHEYIKYFTD